MKWLHMWVIFMNELVDEHAMLMRALANRYLSERTFPTLGAAVNSEEPENEPRSLQLGHEIADLEAVISRLTADIEEIDPTILDLDTLD